MKRFIIQSIAFSLIVVASFGWLLSTADGHSDSFYLKFATPKQQSLILGISRAAQGLQPEVFKEVLNVDIFNYAFTNRHSPYGPAYLRSIKKKLDESAKNGTYIVSVNPWSLSSSGIDPNDTLLFREVGACVDKTIDVDIYPNYRYLINNLKGNYYQLLFGSSNTYLHKDGWLEISVNMDTAIVNRRTRDKVEYYREKLSRYHFSDTRLDYLKKIIRYLNKHGDVYLVRLPVDPGIMNVENEYLPDFNSRIESLFPLVSGYFDITKYNSNFNYVDGNHLYKKSGREVSFKVARWIEEIQNSNPGIRVK